MNKNLQSKVKMYQMVHDLLEENNTLWENIPRLASAIGDFSTKFAVLKETSGEHQRIYSTGVKVQRDEHRKELCKLALIVSKAIKTFAAVEGDKELFLKINLSETSLTKCSQLTMLLKVDEVIHHASLIGESLIEYGISSELLNALIEKRDVLTVGYLAPRKTIVKRKNMAKEIEIMVKEIDDVLRNRIDNLCFLFESTEPAFYRDFKSVRKLLTAVHHKDNSIPTPEEPDDGIE